MESTSVEDLIKALEADTNQWIEKFSSLSNEELNAARGEKWTLGQVVEHVIRTDGAIVQVMQGKTEPESGRNPVEKVGAVEPIFANHEQKYNAFGPLIPSDEPKTVKALENQLKNIRLTAIEALRNLPLDQVCRDFAHFHFGEMTVLEWGHFIRLHSQRHYQMTFPEPA